MSVTYISAQLRGLVRTRAAGRCEYCLLHEDDTAFGCEVDHIVSEKHRGATTAANLAYACFYCNRNKGSDVGSYTDDHPPVLTPFFNPRIQHWDEHFTFDADDSVTIVPKTPVGEVTARILAFNTSERVWERFLLHGTNRYPPQPPHP